MKRVITWLLVTCCVCGSEMYDVDENRLVCTPIDDDICRLALKYDSTSTMHPPEPEHQKNIRGEMLRRMIKTNCSTDAVFFICAAFYPMCNQEHSKLVYPCRSVCNRVKSSCEHVLQPFGLKWPVDFLGCTKFKAQNKKDSMCIDPRSSREGSHAHPSRGKFPAGPSTPARSGQSTESEVPASSSTCSGYRYQDRYHYINRTRRCALRCGEHAMFTPQNQNFSEVWMAVWAGISFFCSLFTVLTFAIDAQRFCYPERSVLFLALCSGVYSLGYIIRVGAGRNTISCDTESGTRILIQEGLENTSCAIVFLLLYYFGMAGAVWWVVLALSWLLSTGLRWSQEALERYSSYFHLAAWALPAVQTIVILVMRAVDGDELTGLCYVGMQDRDRLLGFVIMPLTGYLVVGIVLLSMTCLRLRQRSPPPMDASQSSASSRTPPKRLRMPSPPRGRPAVLCLLYFVPMASVLACFVYEYCGKPIWLAPGDASPSVEVFTIRVFAALAPGITMSLWIWSSKTWRSWAQCCTRICRVQHARKYSNPAVTSSFSAVQYQRPTTQVRYSTNGSLSTVDSRYVLRSASHSYQRPGGETVL